MWRNSTPAILAKVDKDGQIFGGGSSAGGVAGTPQAMASGLYVQSRGQNLFSNGSLLLVNNYNFTGWTFDPVESHGGGGSIKYSSTSPASLICDEYIPVDVTKTYVLSGWCKNGNADGSEDQATATQYYMVVPYDADLIPITPFDYAKHVGSTDTTLAAPLNIGDTTITLTDATGWADAPQAGYQRTIAWYPYTNAKGYTYPDYTYTRNYSYYRHASYGANGTWSSKTGNVLNLNAAWPGPALAAGVKVRNNTSGGTYKYIGLAGIHVPSTWTHYWGVIGGVDTNGVQYAQRFPYGTAYIRPGFLMNYPSTHAGTNTIRWSDMRFQESSSWLAGGDNGSGTTITPLTYSNPGVIDVRGGTTPQIFRIWNTVDDAGTNGDFAYVGWSGNGLYLSSNKAGTGTSRNVYVDSAVDLYMRAFGTAAYTYVGAAYRTYITAANLNPYTDGSMYLGDATHRWRQGWFGGVAAEVPVVARAANLTEWQNSSGTAMLTVDENGYLESPTSLFVNAATSLYLRAIGNEVYFYSAGGYRAYVSASTVAPYDDVQMYLGLAAKRWRQLFVGGVAAEVPIVVKAHASQTANLQEWQNSSATPLAYVEKAGALKSAGFSNAVVAKTANYTATINDHVIKCSASGGAFTITLPAASTATGLLLHIKKTDSSANRITIDGNASELVEDAVTQQLIYQGENLMLQCDGSQWWVL
jgi:hypothetical protein